MKTCLIVASLSFCAGTATAGPLTPPAGPVAPTPGPEPRTAMNAANTPGDADSIFRITAPGSYYLTANLTGVSGKRGIEITTGGVSIDLMGFTLIGAVGSLQGIQSSAAPHVSVRNGVVDGWDSDGIDLSAGQATEQGGLVESVISTNNLGIGINVTGGATVRDCIARGNSAVGILVALRGIVESCAAEDNATHGISTGTGSIIRDCRSDNNTLDGIRLSDGGRAEACLVMNNGRDGIFGGSFQHVAIYNCTAKTNGNDGFEISENSLITGCMANNNTAAGIKTVGTGNRIDSNTVRENGDGINVTSSGNLIIRNSAGGNTTNYDIAASNRVGEVIVPPATAAINGSTGAAAGLGTNDPWANISY